MPGRRRKSGTTKPHTTTRNTELERKALDFVRAYFPRQSYNVGIDVAELPYVAIAPVGLEKYKNDDGNAVIYYDFMKNPQEWGLNGTAADPRSNPEATKEIQQLERYTDALTAAEPAKLAELVGQYARKMGELLVKINSSFFDDYDASVDRYERYSSNPQQYARTNVGIRDILPIIAAIVLYERDSKTAYPDKDKLLKAMDVNEPWASLVKMAQERGFIPNANEKVQVFE